MAIFLQGFLVCALVIAAIHESGGNPLCQKLASGEEVTGADSEEVNACYECEGWFDVPRKLAVHDPSLLDETSAIFWSWRSEGKEDYLSIEFHEAIRLKGFNMLKYQSDSYFDKIKMRYMDEFGEEYPVMNSEHDDEFDMSTTEKEFKVPIVAKSLQVYILTEKEDGDPSFKLSLHSCDEIDDEGVTSDEERLLELTPMGTRSVRVKRAARRSCPLKVPDDCGSAVKGCLGYKLDTHGCPRCACDEKCKDESYLFEGDIRVDSTSASMIKEDYGLVEDKEGVQRSGINRDSARWKDIRSGSNYVVHYRTESSIDSETAGLIRQAMNGISDQSCIVFRQRTNQQYFLSFFRGQGCWSYVGNIRRSNGQQISIGNGCAHLGIIQHEILHALGFYHEQSRPDRDNYVEILFQNIQSGREGNFQKRDNSNTFNTKYDYGSVMHYGSRAFSRNGQETIRPKQSGVQLGQRSGVSSMDMEELRRMYKCSSTGGVETTTAITTTVGSCKDNHGACPYWKERGYCTHSYVAYMRSNCRKSCGLCGQCQDDNVNCPGWKVYCANSIYTAYMKGNCRKTCNFC